MAVNVTKLPKFFITIFFFFSFVRLVNCLFFFRCAVRQVKHTLYSLRVLRLQQRRWIYYNYYPITKNETTEKRFDRRFRSTYSLVCVLCVCECVFDFTTAEWKCFTFRVRQPNCATHGWTRTTAACLFVYSKCSQRNCVVCALFCCGSLLLLRFLFDEFALPLAPHRTLQCDRFHSCVCLFCAAGTLIHLTSNNKWTQFASSNRKLFF